MTDESKVSFERDFRGEEAIVIRDGLNNLDNPRLQDLLHKAGVPPELFKNLINAGCDWLSVPSHEEFFSQGGKLEDIEIGIAKTKLGPIEVSEILLYPDAINPQNINLHLKQRDQRGFEAILVMEGEGTLYFPDTVDPVSIGAYARSKQGINVDIKKGDLAFIPAPTANGWAKASEGFKFRYIGFPPWNSSFVTRTI